MPRQKKLPSGMWKRGDVYYARFRKGGRLIVKRLSSDFDVAREALNDLRARADRSDFGIIDNDYSWDELKKEFLRWAKQKIRRPHQYARHLNQIEKYLKVKTVRQIDHAFVIGYREWRLAQPIYPSGLKAEDRAKVDPKYPAVRTVNMEVATLRAMLNRAVEWKKIGSNPIAGLTPLADNSPRKVRRALSAEEVAAIFAEAPAWLVPVLRLFATTGMRRRALVELRFSDIDFDNRCLTIRAAISKNGKAREIPLDDDAHAMLCDLRDGAKDRQPVPGVTPTGKLSRDHVFVTSANTPLANNLLRAFYATCKRAGVAGGGPGGSVDLHSLRVTFTTLALENGASPKAVQSILGHSTLNLTMSVYARATERAKRDAINVLPFAKVQPPAHVLTITPKSEQKETEARTSFQTVTQVAVS